MIKLLIEDYCQDCPDFEAVGEVTRNYHCEPGSYINQLVGVDTYVRCKYKDRCATMHDFITKKVSEAYGLSKGAI